jgi:hypothetical protein
MVVGTKNGGVMMKYILVLAALMCSAATSAQDLPDKPHRRSITYYDPESLNYTPGPFVKALIDPDTPIPDGMVWHVEHDWWVARKVNSCALCAPPMTFEHAAFDRKSLGMWGLTFALQTAGSAIRERRSCFRELTCQTGNPILAMTSFKEQMSITVPMTFAEWMITAYSRTGKVDYHIGGFKQWWIFPMVFQGLATGGIIADVVRH